MGVQTDSSQALCPAVDHSGGSGAWPPGFRFHPTDEELILYYLKKKICRRRIKLDIIRETDVYKWDPEELPGQSLLKTGDRQWFFFTPRDRKYPNGARSNRATRHGYWKATGKDRNITCNSRSVGVKKTLVFYRGRAPNGERTDWVMHEYTLDEDELNRCQNAQDYYALYKVFKKSGPGPKNGEQYGAPFKEEEWAEDEYVDVFQSLHQGIPAKPLNKVTPLENSMVDSTRQPSLDEIEEFMNQLADEPLLGELQVDDHLYTMPKVVEKEAQSALVEPSSREFVFPEPIHVLQSSAKKCNAPASFDITQSATSQLQSYEASEVTSAPDNYKHTVDISEEGFLEMDDLLDSEPTISNSVENLLYEEMDGLGEDDLFLDSAMFLHDMGPIDQGICYPDVNTLDNDLQNYQLEPYMVDQSSYLAQPDDTMSKFSRLSQYDNMGNQLNYQLPPEDMVNQINYLSQAEDTVNQFNYPSLPDSDVSDQISGQLWLHDQRGEVSTMSALNQEIPSLPTKGVEHESAHHPGPSRQQSRFSSTLWSFVESIPTTPASAAESALVNRAFERMSSFSRVRINPTRHANDDSNRAVTGRAPRNRGFIFISVVGVVCAILWVLMGTVRLWGRCISSSS